MRYRVTQFVHNLVAHPIEGICVLVLGYCPALVTRFHDWTADLMGE